MQLNKGEKTNKKTCDFIFKRRKRKLILVLLLKNKFLKN
jgi:hypothetical protein